MEVPGYQSSLVARELNVDNGSQYWNMYSFFEKSLGVLPTALAAIVLSYLFKNQSYELKFNQVAGLGRLLFLEGKKKREIASLNKLENGLLSPALSGRRKRIAGVVVEIFDPDSVRRAIQGSLSHLLFPFPSQHQKLPLQ